MLLAIGIVVGAVILASKAKAQESNAFMYGTLTTITGDTYTGPIRWGSDEVYWVEMFNAMKTSNDFMKFLSKSEVDKLSEEAEGNSWLGINLNIMSIWEDKYSRTNHRFDTRFGDIKSIEPIRSDRARLTLKNGVILEVKKTNHEDIGTTVRVYDPELGELKFKWSRIEKVDFEEAPGTVEENFGTPIYARVDAGRKGVYTGLIHWGKDERFLEETIDGKDRNGDRAIPFRSIAKIVKRRDGCDITLRSGREFYITGTEDVNGSNSGIVVNDINIGQVTIPWKAFIEMDILNEQPQGYSFNDFPTSQGLSATVITIDGDKHEGLVAYDLDEAWEFEILDAEDDDVEFKIPMRNIKNIIPKNSSYSTVILRDGTDLLLGDSNDVSDSNSGVLIFTSRDEKPVYIRWSRIDEIIFD